MNPVAKALVVLGIVLVAAGLAWQLLGRHLPLGRLPGDIAVERDGFRFHFPIVTCLVLSAVGSLVLLVLRWFGK